MVTAINGWLHGDDGGVSWGRAKIVDATAEQPIGAEIKAILERESRYRAIFIAGPLRDRTLGLDTRPDLIIPILPASKESAVKLLASLQEKNSDTPLLPVLRPADLSEMLDELSRRTRDFLVTPVREPEVLSRVRRLVSWGKPSEQISETAGLTRLIGEDLKLIAIKRQLPLVARHEAAVLLTGETGTGKELCAQAIHYLSP